MATRQTITMTCDLHDDDTEATVTIPWAVDSTNLEIDLCEVHAEAFNDAISPYLQASRRSGRATRRTVAPSGSRPARVDREQLRAMRTWARDNGWPDLGNRGRIPAQVQQAYHERAVVASR